ncbi:MAG TPA: T9SS type A sorting domain-containing protein [Cyclobacteriaceae bacterium]|nr:T9SS type A sorting domain-containing protein [Cyclobacteriaceae bacterium]
MTIDPNPCFNSRKYGGRFDLSWNGGGTNATRLSNWLDPVNTGALTTNTRRIPFINGPSLVCANATFVLQNQWPGTTVTWSSNSSSGLNVNPTTGVATRQGSFSGPVTITATVAGIGPCNAINFTKVVHVGNPTFTNPKVDGSNFYIGSCHGVCPGFHTASLTINGAAPDLMSWTLNPGGAVSWGWDQYNSQIVFETLPYYTQYPFSFVGNISNSCGPAQFTFCFISGPNCQSQVWFNPNPVDDELVLTRGVAEGEASSDLESVEVSLHNSSMENVFSKNTNERIIKIPVIELPEGNYFLRIHTKAGVIQEQIIIKR